MKRHIAIALAAAAACMHASAQENNPGSASSWQMPHQPGFWRYASVSVGRSAYDLECPQGLNVSCNEKDTAFRVAAGGRFNPAFGMEIGYVDLGEVSTAAWQGHARARGLDLGVVGAATIFDRIGVNARIGAIYGWTRSQLRVASRQPYIA